MEEQAIPKSNKKWYAKTGWAILFLIFFFPVGLFLMWKFTNWNKVVKWAITGIFALFIISSIFSSNSSNSQSQQSGSKQSDATPTQAAQITVAPTKPLTIDQQVWVAIDKAFGTRENYAAAYYPDLKGATLTISVDQAFDENSIVRASFTSLVKYGREVFKLPNVNQVEITYKTKFTDSYGKSVWDKAVDIVMSKEEFQKFDWDNLKYTPVADRIQAASSFFYINPAIEKNTKADQLFLSL